jgi:hypothetical protein
MNEQGENALEKSKKKKKKGNGFRMCECIVSFSRQRQRPPFTARSLLKGGFLLLVPNQAILDYFNSQVEMTSLGVANEEWLQTSLRNFVPGTLLWMRRLKRGDPV